MCVPVSPMITPMESTNKHDTATSSRSRRRNRRKQLRSKEEENVSDQVDVNKLKSSSTAVDKTKHRKRNFKRSLRESKTTRGAGKEKGRGKSSKSSTESISSNASTASTASLTDTSTKYERSASIPQHVQLHKDSSNEEFKSRFLALDCEMVGIGESGKQSALGRVSIVNWDGEVVFDTFVRVTEPITDLRTFVSGLKISDVDGSCTEATMELEACLRRVKAILSGKILVGHALKNDLRVLGLTHPWYDTRDTTKYDAFLKDSPNGDGMRLPRKLRDLAHDVLNWDIQEEGVPHCSIVDAVAAMNLYKSVSSKWEKVMEYKKKRTEEILNMQRKVESAN